MGILVFGQGAGRYKVHTMAPEKMAPEKMAPEKMAPGKKGTRKKWHYVNLERMAPQEKMSAYFHN